VRHRRGGARGGCRGGTWWRRTRRSVHQWVCGMEMKGLGFRGSGTLKKKNSSDGYHDIINARRYI
jgi:hypothetical protein